VGGELDDPVLRQVRPLLDARIGEGGAGDQPGLVRSEDSARQL
jgi:hypothetical protein